MEKSTVKNGARLEGYLGSSVKGEAAIDWSDKRARAALLSLIVAADRAGVVAGAGGIGGGQRERQQIVAAAELLSCCPDCPRPRTGDVEHR